MRRIFILILILSVNATLFAQQDKYATKTISRWSLERFPLRYHSNPAKKNFYTNRITGKLEAYEELNRIGQLDGLKVIMSSDGVNPESVLYVYKGEMVYSATYFPNSKTAEMITTYNEKGEKHGYRITRKLKNKGGYTEEIEKYSNGVLVELNGIKQASASLVFKDHLLEGKFKFINSNNCFFEGEAEKGKIKRIKKMMDGLYFMGEIIFLSDSIEVKEPCQHKDGVDIEKIPLFSNPIITDSKELCLKYGNYNGYPYLLLSDMFDISNIKEIAQQHYPAPFETIVNYTDSLLDGEFQFREYKYTGGFYYNGIINIKGKAEKGRIIFLKQRDVNIDPFTGNISSDKTIEYHFNGNKISQQEFIPELPNEPISSRNIDLLYPVLLTNSNYLGGKYYYDYNNTRNPLSVPIERNNKIENNKYGYIYFSPTTFDISSYLSIITTRTEKPIVNNVPINNGFIDGDFEFKEDRILFTGNAKDGIIQAMKIKFDFIDSKTLKGEYNEKTFDYDEIEIALNGNIYTITYMLSRTGQKNYEHSASALNVKKVTVLESLSGYDKFIYIKDYEDLRNALFEMKFLCSENNSQAKH